MIFKNKPFDKNLATGIFVVSVIVWMFNTGIQRFYYQREMAILSFFIYFDMVFFTSLISGLISGNKGVITERRNKKK